MNLARAPKHIWQMNRKHLVSQTISGLLVQVSEVTYVTFEITIIMHALLWCKKTRTLLKGWISYKRRHSFDKKSSVGQHSSFSTSLAMFSKFAVLASLALLAVATPMPNEPASSCSTGDLQCCDTTGSASDPAIATELGFLGVVVQDIDALVGLTCSPITVRLNWLEYEYSLTHLYSRLLVSEALTLATPTQSAALIIASVCFNRSLYL